MNFLFTVTVHGFDKAAKLEKVMKENSIPFETTMLKPINGSNAKAPRKVFSKPEVAAVIAVCHAHPEWTDRQIAKQSGCGHETVRRIRLGKHRFNGTPL